jgi:2-keto-4-pentenoate hydratase/2-oxohepta-3-ene-1,7-dioic acid hydratase in catechol pathway
MRIVHFETGGVPGIAADEGSGWHGLTQRDGGFPGTLPELIAQGVDLGAHGLRIQGRLNGQVMQDARTDQLIFSVPALIEMISVAMSLEPGDVIITGTPGGVGVARKPPVFMRPGDVFEVEIEGIGVLSNVVQDE